MYIAVLTSCLVLSSFTVKTLEQQVWYRSCKWQGMACVKHQPVLLDLVRSGMIIHATDRCRLKRMGVIIPMPPEGRPVGTPDGIFKAKRRQWVDHITQTVWWCRALRLSTFTSQVIHRTRGWRPTIRTTLVKDRARLSKGRSPWPKRCYG